MQKITKEQSIKGELETSFFYDDYYEFNNDDWFPGIPYPGRWL